MTKPKQVLIKMDKDKHEYTDLVYLHPPDIWPAYEFLADMNEDGKPAPAYSKDGLHKMADKVKDAFHMMHSLRTAILNGDIIIIPGDSHE